MSNILNDPLFQAAIISPVMGVVFGALFSALTKHPSKNVPETIVHTKETYVERVIVKNEHDNSNSASNDLSFPILLTFGLFFISWQYAVWAADIHFYLIVVLLGILSFSTTTAFISYLKGHFTSSDWWLFTCMPILLLALDVYVLKLAISEFDPELTREAANYSFFDFYINRLTGYGQTFMIFHVAGIILLSASVILLGLVSLYYLSLMNQRSDGTMQQVWSWLTKVTSFCSGSGWLVVSIVLIATSYIFVNPSYAVSWLIG